MKTILAALLIVAIFVAVPVSTLASMDAAADMAIRALHDFIDDHPPAYLAAKAKAQAEGLDWVQ